MNVSSCLPYSIFVIMISSTGWEDVSLAAEGVKEAQAAGRLLKAHGFTFDVVYTRYACRSRDRECGEKCGNLDSHGMIPCTASSFYQFLLSLLSTAGCPVPLKLLGSCWMS